MLDSLLQRFRRHDRLALARLVSLVARGANLEALQRDGLVLELPERTQRPPGIRAVDDPVLAPPPELVLVCVKSYDTPAAARALRPVVGRDTIVLSLQNGIENAGLAQGDGGCGSRPARGSNSSDSNPTSLRSASNRSNSSRASRCRTSLTAISPRW